MRVISIQPSELAWPFESGPWVKTSPLTSYSRTINVDPFPCYPHQQKIAEETATLVEASFPISPATTIYLIPFEGSSRTNGHANRDYNYDVKPATWEPYIVMWGKRIPPHPGMTRYLVAHEYGHIVQWWIEEKRGIKDQAVTDFDREYMKLRPDASPDYGGGRWHDHVGELIANDFRLIVTGIETEYWPHPGFTRPEELPEVVAFWENAVKEFSFKPEATTPETPVP